MYLHSGILLLLVLNRCNGFNVCPFHLYDAFKFFPIDFKHFKQLHLRMGALQIMFSEMRFVIYITFQVIS